MGLVEMEPYPYDEKLSLELSAFCEIVRHFFHYGYGVDAGDPRIEQSRDGCVSSILLYARLTP
jgi:hypothetical protein